jgi:hypothetical protein
MQQKYGRWPTINQLSACERRKFWGREQIHERGAQ